MTILMMMRWAVVEEVVKVAELKNVNGEFTVTVMTIIKDM
jgi:hypothetical protein